MDQARAERIGRNIRDRRSELDYTQGRLSHILDISATSVSSWERGIHIPSGDNAWRLAQALETTPADLGLLPEEAGPPPRPMPPLWFTAWDQDRMEFVRAQIDEIHKMLNALLPATSLEEASRSTQDG